LSKEFPCLPSYSRFIELAERVVIPLGMFLTTRYGQCTGISFIDSTALDVCQNQRIKQHKVFKGLAARSKTSTGWFYGFKLHLAVHKQGELLGVKLTTGNVDDPVHVRQWTP
jgi:Transposase DDE domain